jgi:hypothetical protein
MLAIPNGQAVAEADDVVIDGVRHERPAWSHDAPGPSRHVGRRFGFWREVKVA